MECKLTHAELKCVHCKSQFTSLLVCAIHHTYTNHKQFRLLGTDVIHEIDNYIEK